MNVTIYTHYEDTEPIAGTFDPAGDGVLADTLSAEIGDTDGVVAAWTGTKCGVQIIQRLRRGSLDERELVVWVSVADKQATVHTVEMSRDSSEFSFGYLTVTVD
jgi:hypothetical protein